jgi:serpin B
VAGEQTSGSTDPVAASDLDREAASAADAAPAVDAVQAFTAELYRALAGEEQSGNLLCSPYSVFCALAMTRTGALGVTAAEMDAVLHAPQPSPDRLGQTLNALSQLIESRAGTFQSGGEPTEIVIDVANSLWGQQGTAWEQAFLDALATNYGAGMNQVDYRTQAEAARQEINRWVGERTHGKIPDLLAPGTVDSLTRLVLVNAIYLKAAWYQKFSLDGTGPFTRLDGGQVQVPMMRSTFSGLSYARGEDWEAVSIPYIGGKLSMAVILPAEGALTELEQNLDGAWLESVLTGFRSQRVQLRMPSWTFRTQATLNGILGDLGMPTAFSDGADLSGMTRDEDLSITAVVHEAFIAVDKDGTEAAAATAVVVGVTSVQVDPPIEVTLDRSFLFVIQDTSTATPLFIGRVDNPNAG